MEEKINRVIERFNSIGFIPKEDEVVFVNLAKDYLLVKMPEEIENTGIEIKQTKEYRYGFNDCLHLCRLAYLKMIPSEEEIEEVVSSFIKPLYKEAFIGGDKSESCAIQIHNITTTLHKLLKERIG
jgi:hypothetical protein